MLDGRRALISLWASKGSPSLLVVELRSSRWPMGAIPWYHPTTGSGFSCSLLDQSMRERLGDPSCVVGLSIGSVELFGGWGGWVMMPRSPRCDPRGIEVLALIVYDRYAVCAVCEGCLLVCRLLVHRNGLVEHVGSNAKRRLGEKKKSRAPPLAADWCSAFAMRSSKRSGSGECMRKGAPEPRAALLTAGQTIRSIDWSISWWPINRGKGTQRQDRKADERRAAAAGWRSVVGKNEYRLCFLCLMF